MNRRDIIHILEQSGFKEGTNNGHTKFYNAATGKTAMVGNHPGDVAGGTLNSIWDQAGLGYLKNIKTTREAEIALQEHAKDVAQAQLPKVADKQAEQMVHNNHLTEGFRDNDGNLVFANEHENAIIEIGKDGKATKYAFASPGAAYDAFMERYSATGGTAPVVRGGIEKLAPDRKIAPIVASEENLRPIGARSEPSLNVRGMAAARAAPLRELDIETFVKVASPGAFEDGTIRRDGQPVHVYQTKTGAFNKTQLEALQDTLKRNGVTAELNSAGTNLVIENGNARQVAKALAADQSIAARVYARYGARAADHAAEFAETGGAAGRAAEEAGNVERAAAAERAGSRAFSVAGPVVVGAGVLVLGGSVKAAAATTAEGYVPGSSTGFKGIRNSHARPADRILDAADTATGAATVGAAIVPGGQPVAVGAAIGNVGVQIARDIAYYTGHADKPGLMGSAINFQDSVSKPSEKAEAAMYRALLPMSGIANFLLHDPDIHGKVSPELGSAIYGFGHIQSQSGLQRIEEGSRFAHDLSKALREPGAEGDAVRAALQPALAKAEVTAAQYADVLDNYAKALDDTDKKIHEQPANYVGIMQSSADSLNPGTATAANSPARPFAEGDIKGKGSLVKSASPAFAGMSAPSPAPLVASQMPVQEHRPGV